MTKISYVVLLFLVFVSCERNNPSASNGVIDDTTSSPQDTTRMSRISTEISYIYFSSNSFNINWKSVNNEDFLSYQLFMADEKDTTDWELIFESSNYMDDNYIKLNETPDNYIYFKILVSNKDSVTGPTHTMLASSHRLIAYSTQIENRFYISTIDINGKCNQVIPTSSHSNNDIRLDPLIFSNNKIICDGEDTWVEGSWYGELYTIDLSGRNLKKLSSGHNEHPILDPSTKSVYYVDFSNKVFGGFTSSNVFKFSLTDLDAKNLTESDSFIVTREKPTVLNDHTILFTATSAVYTGDTTITMDIYACDLNTLSSSIFIENASHPIVSPNKNYLLYFKYTDKWYKRQYRRVFLDLNTLSERDISFFPPRNYSFSPDGNSVIGFFDLMSLSVFNIITGEKVEIGSGYHRNAFFLENSTVIWQSDDQTFTIKDLDSFNEKEIKVDNVSSFALQDGT